MSVERRLRQYAEALTRELAGTDRDALRERTLAASQATGVNSPNPSGSQSPASHHPVAGSAEELRHHHIQAEKGDTTSAVRLAELYDLLDREDEAATWWRQAADLGDRHAIDYVQEFLAPVDNEVTLGALGGETPSEQEEVASVVSEGGQRIR